MKGEGSLYRQISRTTRENRGSHSPHYRAGSWASFRPTPHTSCHLNTQYMITSALAFFEHLLDVLADAVLPRTLRSGTVVFILQMRKLRHDVAVTCPNCTGRNWEPRQSGSRNYVLGNQELALRSFPTQTLWLPIFSCCFHLSSRVCPSFGAALSVEDSHVSFALPLSPCLFLTRVLVVSPACVSHRAPSRGFSVSVSALLMLSLTVSLLSLSLLLLLFLSFFSLLLSSSSCVLLTIMTTQTLVWWTSVFAVMRVGLGLQNSDELGAVLPALCGGHTCGQKHEACSWAIPDPGDGHSLHSPSPCLCPTADDWLGSGWL